MHIDKKKVISVIAAKLAPKEPNTTYKTEMERLTMPDHEDMELETAAEAILKAIKGDNAKELSSALMAFDEIADSKHGLEEEEKEEENEPY